MRRRQPTTCRGPGSSRAPVIAHRIAGISPQAADEPQLRTNNPPPKAAQRRAISLRPPDPDPPRCQALSINARRVNNSSYGRRHCARKKRPTRRGLGLLPMSVVKGSQTSREHIMYRQGSAVSKVNRPNVITAAMALGILTAAATAAPSGAPPATNGAIHTPTEMTSPAMPSPVAWVTPNSLLAAVTDRKLAGDSPLSAVFVPTDRDASEDSGFVIGPVETTIGG